MGFEKGGDVLEKGFEFQWIKKGSVKEEQIEEGYVTLVPIREFSS